MRLPRRIEIEVTDFDFKGYAYGKWSGSLIYVIGAIPGEKVRCCLVNKRKRIYVAEEILEQSEHRIKPPCPYYGACGGCDWQHIRYSSQLLFKEKFVEKAFFGIEEGTYNKIIPAVKQWNYRGKTELAFSRLDGKELKLGFRERGKFWKVIDLEECLIQEEGMNKLMHEVKEFVREKDYSAWNPWRHKGFLRYLVLRHSTIGEHMMNIITSSEGQFPLKELYDSFSTKPESSFWSVSDSVADVAFGEIKDKIGKDYIVEKTLGYEFAILPYSFYQTNPYQAPKLYELVRKYAEEGGKLAIDYYAGSAVISIICSDLFEKIVAIEADEYSVNAAKINLEKNQVKNVEIMHAEVEDTKGKFSNVDVAFVDPPRAGLSKHAMKALISAEPKRIVYVSCNVVSMARDIRILRMHGYKLIELTPIDMLPQTHHLELVALLEKK